MIPFRTTAPAPGSPAVTMTVIVINVAVFLYQIGLPSREATQFVYEFALVPAVYAHPGLARQAGLDPGNFLPLVTNTFMHGGWLHLILNMWTLWLFGVPLESRIGPWRFLLFYLACGTAGSIGHLVFNLDSVVPALGASGAVAGVFGGFTLSFPRAKVAVVQPIFIFPVVFHLPAVVYMLIWFAFQMLGGWTTLAAGPAGGGIAWWAHIVGFLTGLALAIHMGRRRPPVRPRSGPWS